MDFDLHSVDQNEVMVGYAEPVTMSIASSQQPEIMHAQVQTVVVHSTNNIIYCVE